MKKLNAVLLAVLGASSLYAAKLEQVIVRQQWPWSTDVKVEYMLSGVTAAAPVDISVKVYNGDVELNSSRLADAITGDLYGISEDGVGQFVIDPVKAFGTGKIALANFKVKLTVSDSAADLDEVLYKIFPLEANSGEPVVNITRKELLNRKYGSVVTDYSTFGSGFKTTLAKPVIWTAVTNDVRYKTTHLVMRRIPKGTFICGGSANTPGIEVTLPNDYFIGVFEMTQKQCELLSTTRATPYFNNPACAATRPMDNVSFSNIRGDTSKSWPSSTGVANTSYVGILRSRLGIQTFDLPTEAQWEKAARGGNATVWNNGETDTTTGRANSVIPKLGRSRYTGGFVDDGTTATEPPQDCTTEHGTAEVGSYAPNAFGLYDCHGNVQEWCLDRYVEWGSVTADILLNGSTAAGEANRVLKCGSYSHTPSSHYADERSDVAYNTSAKNYGFRVVFIAE